MMAAFGIILAILAAIAAFARSSNGGLIVTGSALAVVHRDLIITLAAQHKLSAVYFQRFFVTTGGFISYGARNGWNCSSRSRSRRRPDRAP
jgi:hypothetical protein